MITEKKPSRKEVLKSYNHNKLVTFFDAKEAPRVVVIFPHRDRKAMKNVMNDICKDMAKIKYIFIEQPWGMPFNKGLLLNIGFKIVKSKFPDNYGDITLVLHDIDVILSMDGIKDKSIFFRTAEGIVKHFHGFNYSLNGILSLLMKDMETINGLPNIFGWGREDIIFQQRVYASGMAIIRDESTFIDANASSENVTILSKQVPFVHDYRTYVESEDKRSYMEDIKQDGIDSILSYEYTIDGRNILLTTFQTKFQDSVDLTKCYCTSNTKFPKKLIPKGAKEKQKDKWFIIDYSSELHRRYY